MKRRLVALALTPMVAVAAIGGAVVVHARQVASTARAVEVAVGPVRDLMSLSHAVQQEQGATRFQLRAASLGIPARDLAALAGSQALTERTARATTDAALRRARTLVRTDFAGAMSLARAEADSASADSFDVGRKYLALDAQVQQRLAARVARLERRVAALDDGTHVADAMSGLDALDAVLHNTAARFDDLDRLVFGAPSTRQQVLVSIGRDSGLFDAAESQFEAVPLGAASRRWKAMAADPDVRALERIFAEIADGRSLPSGQALIAAMVSPLRGITKFEAVSGSLVDETSNMLARAAHVLRTTAESRYRLTLLEIAATSLVSLALALWIARSITRPLRRLSHSAREVSDGRLELEPLAESGPTETAVVAKAFNDLVGNLRLLEAKSQALAACDLENPVLGRPLPGRLGASIQASIHLLSGSIEERDQLQRRLAFEATHDSLTGLQNRAAALAALESALARARRTGEPVAVLFVDLDGFKLVNDAHGHDVGDRVLQSVADRMHALVRDGDIVARLGGDEFLVVAERTAALEATTLAQRIRDRIAEPIEVGTHRLTVGTSVGIALSLDAAGNPADLLARADLALYRAKDRGRSHVELFDESLQEQLLRRLDIEEALADTLARGGDELELHYQPVVDSSGRLTGAEALVRWHRPGVGAVFPDDFIPVAEASNLIIDLDRWVLERAARQSVAWSAVPGMESISVAVNVSGRHLLSERLDGHVRSVLERTGLAPAKLVLEVTETVLLTDIPVAAGQLEALRALGVRIALDDFGTGYTSLAALHGLPIDSIKIDRSFVSQIHDERDGALVAMITELGHQLGFDVVAEGVETPSQERTLRELGCDAMQGFLISRPIPVADFRARYGNVPSPSPGA